MFNGIVRALLCTPLSAHPSIRCVPTKRASQYMYALNLACGSPSDWDADLKLFHEHWNRESRLYWTREENVFMSQDPIDVL